MRNIIINMLLLSIMVLRCKNCSNSRVSKNLYIIRAVESWMPKFEAIKPAAIIPMIRAKLILCVIIPMVNTNIGGMKTSQLMKICVDIMFVRGSIVYWNVSCNEALLLANCRHFYQSILRQFWNFNTFSGREDVFKIFFVNGVEIREIFHITQKAWAFDDVL